MHVVRLPALVLAAALLQGGADVAAAQPAKRLCLSQAEAAEAVSDGALIEPRRMLRRAAAQAKAEALGAKLCRWDETLIYEFTLLRQDGRVLFVYVDASSGKVVDSP